MSTVTMGPLRFGNDLPCVIIAEAGVNHNGDMDTARRLIDAAKAAGADAVKFQSFITEDLITIEAEKAEYQVTNTGEPGGQFAMLKALEFDEAQHAELKAHCDEAGITYLCTPYEQESVDRLVRLGVCGFKIASTDTTNLPLLAYIARQGLPVLLSTGMCDLAEVRQAVDTLYQGGLENQLVVLHCTAEYPAPLAECNLKAIDTLRDTFACPVGFSDHTPGIGAAPWAVARGAVVIEKHFTLDRALPGPDHAASLEPGAFAGLVACIRQVESALGDGEKMIAPSERENKSRMQKSLVLRRDLQPGETIRAEDLACKRPATGLPPSQFNAVAGRKAARFIPADRVLRRDDIDGEAP